MIARLTGTLAETASDHCVLDVSGVGYLILASTRTLSAIGPVGGDVMLLTELQVREDSMTLFGFGSAGEREWFRLLTGVQGVGGKVGLNILSALDAEELSLAVGTQDKAMVARANGVGPKLAERIVRELKDKVGGVVLGAAGSLPKAAGSLSSDAVSALTGLGFKPSEAGAAVAAAEAELGAGATLDALVRLALKKAAKT
jgi:holliday junction DNA helicase RuvA